MQYIFNIQITKHQHKIGECGVKDAGGRIKKNLLCQVLMIITWWTAERNAYCGHNDSVLKALVTMC